MYAEIDDVCLLVKGLTSFRVSLAEISAVEPLVLRGTRRTVTNAVLTLSNLFGGRWDLVGEGGCYPGGVIVRFKGWLWRLVPYLPRKSIFLSLEDSDRFIADLQHRLNTDEAASCRP